MQRLMGSRLPVGPSMQLRRIHRTRVRAVPSFGGLFQARRLGQPSGHYSVIDIGNTNDLKPGDVIFVEGFGFGASLLYGNSESFTVFAIDSGANKVGVTDESGDQHWFDGGTKAELLAKLQDKAGYDKVIIYRPSGGAQPPPSASSEQPVSNDFWKALANLIWQARLKGLPSNYGPNLAAGALDSAAPGDYVIFGANSVPRLYSVVSQSTDPVSGIPLTDLALVGTDVMTSADWKTNDLYDPPIGTEQWFPFMPLDFVSSISFRAGFPTPTQPQDVVQTPAGPKVKGGGSSLSDILVPAGLAALLIGGWVLLES